MSEFVENCPRCGSKSTTFDVIGDHKIGNRGDLSVHEIMCVCRHCLKASVATVLSKNGQHGRALSVKGSITQLDGSIFKHFIFGQFISPADQAISDIPEHLPESVKNCFTEGALCFGIGCFNAAGAMFRLCLDVATKNLLPEDGSPGGPNQNQRKRLYDRIEWLLATDRLPEGLRALANCVREDGNDAAHSGSLTKDDAEDLIDFSRVLLERVYTEPARLRLAAERRSQRRG